MNFTFLFNVKHRSPSLHLTLITIKSILWDTKGQDCALKRETKISDKPIDLSKNNFASSHAISLPIIDDFGWVIV
jgi:hypothetical protein